jgi:gamma-glutamylaminecyclotransferase
VTLVFVYGTLKRGGGNHAFMAGQEFVGEARTTAAYPLYELSGYPGMQAADGHAGVTGEVWSVDDGCLARLDELEGVSEGLYSRGPVSLLAPFADRTVEGYLYLKSVDGRRLLGDTWTG